MAETVTIFISHKHEDKKIAQTVKQELEAVSSRVHCFISEDIAAGAEWLTEIRQYVEKAHILLLLFTASTSEWDWPLYEVGLATDLSDPSRCRIVCVYPSGATPPDPIRAFQAVEASPEGLEVFLRQLFCSQEIVDVDPVLNERLREGESLTRLARHLSESITTVKPWAYCFTHYLWIDVEDAIDNEEIQAEAVPQSATVDPESTALQLFGLAPSPPNRDRWQWDGLLDRLDEESNQDWVSALGERFRWAAAGSQLKSMTASFTSPADGQSYRPVLHRAERRRDASMRFEVIFVEGAA